MVPSPFFSSSTPALGLLLFNLGGISVAHVSLLDRPPLDMPKEANGPSTSEHPEKKQRPRRQSDMDEVNKSKDDIDVKKKKKYATYFCHVVISESLPLCFVQRRGQA
jgi:hypothetical protein